MDIYRSKSLVINDTKWKIDSTLDHVPMYFALYK